MAFAPQSDGHRLWSLQKLSVQGYGAGLMDTGSDAVRSLARALQSRIRRTLARTEASLCAFGGHFSNVSSETCDFPEHLFQAQ